MFIEYPKALYRGDELREVADKDEEAAARSDGFRFWSDESEPEPVKRGPGRPKKVAE